MQIDLVPESTWSRQVNPPSRSFGTESIVPPRMPLIVDPEKQQYPNLEVKENGTLCVTTAAWQNLFGKSCFAARKEEAELWALYAPDDAAKAVKHGLLPKPPQNVSQPFIMIVVSDGSRDKQASISHNGSLSLSLFAEDVAKRVTLKLV